MAANQNAFDRAARVMPGGVSSPVRSFKSVGGTPPFIAAARGAILTDIDGKSYIDYIGSYGPAILGHAEPRVVRAIADQLEKGFGYGTPTTLETELAELILSALPGHDMIRFVNSGTEAAMSAIRLARGATARSIVIKCAGCYHGHVDALLVNAGSGALTHGTPSSPGVPDSITANTVVVPYNDLSAAAAAMDAHRGAVACFAVEPIAGNMGLVPPEPGYLQGLRKLCDAHGVLLLFDEVMTGFRIAWGGAQRLYGVRPDITCLGKVVGGGLPVGAYCGPAHLMRQVSPAGPIYQAGTLSGNPLATTAGLATLRILRDEDGYSRLEAASARLEQGLRMALPTATVQRVGSMLTPFFTGTASRPVRNLKDATACDTAGFARFFHRMLAAGVHVPPSQFEAWFVGLGHTDQLIDQTIESAVRAADR
jgi:glutamate-1-semialdehyde 2,1-aminomutase